MSTRAASAAASSSSKDDEAVPMEVDSSAAAPEGGRRSSGRAASAAAAAISGKDAGTAAIPAASSAAASSSAGRGSTRGASASASSSAASSSKDAAPPAISADAASSAAASSSAAAPSENLEMSWNERTRQRKKALSAVREKEKKALKADQKMGAKGRLAYLMRQADIFSHFVKDPLEVEAARAEGQRQEAAAAVKGGGQGRRGKGRMTEKQEDALLLQHGDDKQDAAAMTRLTKQPKCIVGGEMRSYQIEGLNWLIKLHEHGINGILADEMGLGKTLQTISLLGYLQDVCNLPGPHLVITPKSTLTNWVNECKRWCPSLRVFKFHGDKAARAGFKSQYLDTPNSFDVCITTYESVLSEQASFCKLVWRYCIIDEAHRIKNEKSSLSQVVRKLTSHFRLLITGTPLQNNLHELWAMLNFLLPDIFADAATFDEWFGLEDAKGDKATDVLTQLHRILRPFLLRRLKCEVEKDLPPKREIKLLIGMSEMQRKWYANILGKNIDVLNAMGANRTRMLNTLMQLRKCTNHPYLFEGAEQPPFVDDERLVHNSGKMVLLDKLLAKLKAGGHRVLIFSQMTRMLDILEDYCQFREWEYCRIDGSTSGEDRDEAMELYNAAGSSTFVFMLSTRAGGLGINLATADTVILYDSDWNPQADLQAMDRAHRIGQTKPVVVYRFMTEGTVEEKVIERAQKKLFLDAAVIQQGKLAEASTALSKDEMLSMIRFGADAVFSAQGAAPTDEDIDALLARGEERTKKDNERFQAATANSLASFSLGGEEKSLYEFEGQDYSDASWAVSLPKRERRANYDENEYYRNLKGVPKPPKQITVSDFQFFNVPRLEELRAKEVKNYEFKKMVWDRRYAGDRELRGSAPLNEVAPLSAEELEAAEAAAPPLSEEEEEEKERLMQQGFGSWTRKDLVAFVRGLEEYGRDDLAKVATEVEGKSQREVCKYACTFFKRCHEIKECEKLMRRIELGDAKRVKYYEKVNAVATKVYKTKDPFCNLKIDYTAGGAPKPKAPYGTTGAFYSEANDRHLICLANQIGWGRWEQLMREARKSPCFIFDYYIKTRGSQELGARCEQLAALIVAEAADKKAAAAAAAADAAAAEKKAGAEAKKAKRNSGGAGSSRAGKAPKDDGGGGGEIQIDPELLARPLPWYWVEGSELPEDFECTSPWYVYERERYAEEDYRV